jgi:hypothetical protein
MERMPAELGQQVIFTNEANWEAAHHWPQGSIPFGYQACDLQQVRLMMF